MDPMMRLHQNSTYGQPGIAGWIVTRCDEDCYLGSTYDDTELIQYMSILTVFGWEFDVTFDQVDGRWTEHNKWTTFRRVWNTR